MDSWRRSLPPERRAGSGGAAPWGRLPTCRGRGRWAIRPASVCARRTGPTMSLIRLSCGLVCHGNAGTHFRDCLRRHRRGRPWPGAGDHLAVRLLQRPLSAAAEPRVEAINGPGAEVPGDDRRGTAGADGQVPQAAGCGRDAGRPAGRGLRRLPRGRPAGARACGTSTCS